MRAGVLRTKDRDPIVKRVQRPPERTCAATRRTDIPERMIRFVLDPGGDVVADIRRRLPGRGAWLVNERATVDLAARKNPFRRAFGGDVRVDPALAETVGRQLRDDALSTLAMANKAGLVVSGFDKVRDGLKRGRIALLVCASDAAENGRSRLARLAVHGGCSPGGVLFVNVFSIEDLSRTVGRDHVVHAGVSGHALADAFVRRARRYATYLGRAGEVGAATMTAFDEAATDAAGSPAAEPGETDGPASDVERQTRAFAGTRAV